MPQWALVAVFLLILGVSASFLLPLPSFMWSRGDAPERVAVTELNMEDLTCRGRANLFVYFLDRDDELRIPGYLRLEAWPGPEKPASA